MKIDDYEFSDAGVCIERHSHFAQDVYDYFIIVKIGINSHYMSITKGQFERMLSIGVNAYNRDYTPNDGYLIKKHK